MITRGDVLYITHPYYGSCLAPLAKTSIEWLETEEQVYTNERGWRVRYPEDTQCYSSDLAVIGCSWAMGVGVNYPGSFVGLLEDKLSCKAANLAVGSFSLLQAVMRLEQEISFIRPKVVLLPYGSWMVDRCLKDRSAKVHYRPVLKRHVKTGELVIQRGRWSPNWLVRHYVRVKNFLTRNKGFLGVGRCYLNLLSYFAKLHHGYAERLLKRLLGKSETVRINGEETKHREDILVFCFNKLMSICKQYEAKVLVCYLFNWEQFNERRFRIESDKQFFEKFSKQQTDFFYVDWNPIRSHLDQYLSEKSAALTAKDYIKHFCWADHSHPNYVGHRLIAEAMLPTLQAVLNSVKEPASLALAD